MRRLLNRRSSVWETATAGAECWRAMGLFFLYPGSVPLFWIALASQYDRAVADASSKNRAGGMALLRKKQILKVLEPGTLLYFPGHVMMYLGYENGNFYVINDVSRLVKEGETMPVRVRSVIVNTLAVRRPNLRTWMEELTLALIPWET